MMDRRVPLGIAEAGSYSIDHQAIDQADSVGSFYLQVSRQVSSSHDACDCGEEDSERHEEVRVLLKVAVYPVGSQVVLRRLQTPPCEPVGVSLILGESLNVSLGSFLHVPSPRLQVENTS